MQPAEMMEVLLRVPVSMRDDVVRWRQWRCRPAVVLATAGVAVKL